MKFFLVVLMWILTITQVQADERPRITLSAISMANDGDYVIKHYQSDDALKVIYHYQEDAVGDSTYETILYLSFEEGGSDWIPADIVKFGFVAGGDLDLNVRKFGINSNPLSEDCYFAGNAIVKLHKMEMVLPEYASGVNTSAKIKEVISSTTPQLKCN